MAVLAALPPSIFCASALTVDALLIGVCMVYVAYCIKILDKNAPLQKTQVVLIAFMTLLIMLLKAPYAALALIYLALPSKIWPAKQKAIAAGATLACFAVLYGLWAANFQMTYVHPSVNYQEESAYVMTNLPYVLFICFINCIYTLCIVAPVYCMYIIFPIAIALVVTCSRSSHGTPKSILITALLCVLIVITVIFVFEALTWCNVSAGVTNLYGFQERYALPLLPLFAFLAKNPVISKCNTHALQNLSQVVTETN